MLPDASRFSLRLPRPFSIGVTAIVLVVACLGFRFGSSLYWRQVAIRDIRQLGGDIQLLEAGPNWLRPLVGDHLMGLFDKVRAVQFGSVADSDLWCLDSIQEVEYVDLGSQNVTDAGLFRIAGLACLESLCLGETKVTDTGLANLGQLEKLRRLDLSETRVTPAGLRHLTPLVAMESLSLAGTDATDDGLAHISGLTNMRELDLSRTRITDSGLLHLTRMTRLTRLHLDWTAITGAGAASLNRVLPNRPLNGFVPRVFHFSPDPFGILPSNEVDGQQAMTPITPAPCR